MTHLPFVRLNGSQASICQQRLPKLWRSISSQRQGSSTNLKHFMNTSCGSGKPNKPRTQCQYHGDLSVRVRFPETSLQSRRIYVNTSHQKSTTPEPIVSDVPNAGEATASTTPDSGRNQETAALIQSTIFVSVFSRISGAIHFEPKA